MGEAGGAGPQSERVVAGGWALEECGAGNDTERVWVYPSGDGVKVAWEDDSGVRMRVVPCTVLAHVLRVHGYAVQREAEAAE